MRGPWQRRRTEPHSCYQCSLCIEQEQSRLFQSDMESLSAMTFTCMLSGHMPKTEIVRVMGKPLGGAQNALNHKSGHPHEWDCCLSWAMRTQRSDSSTLELGCYHGSCSESNRTSTPSDSGRHCSCRA